MAFHQMKTVGCLLPCPTLWSLYELTSFRNLKISTKSRQVTQTRMEKLYQKEGISKLSSHQITHTPSSRLSTPRITMLTITITTISRLILQPMDTIMDGKALHREQILGITRSIGIELRQALRKDMPIRPVLWVLNKCFCLFQIIPNRDLTFHIRCRRACLAMKK